MSADDVSKLAPLPITAI